MKIQLIAPDGAKYIPFAQSKLYQLEQIRQQSGLPVIRRLFPVEKYNIFIEARGIASIIRIEGGLSGFLFHPRSNDFPNGLNPDGEQLTSGPYQYPLVDGDHGTQNVYQDGNAWGINNDPPENYGNIDWIGSDGEVLTWRGPAGRMFAMDREKSFPGFTVLDEETLTNLYYTPYSNKIYQGGEVLYEFPQGYKVLGAAINSGKLVAVVSFDYKDQTNPDGSTGGFYDEVWVSGERIGYRRGSRPTTPWFFNGTGDEAVCGNSKLKITEECKEAIFSVLAPGGGVQSEDYGGEEKKTWSVVKQGAWTLFRDYALSEERSVNLLFSFHENSSRENSGEGMVFDDLPIRYSGTPASEVVINGPDAYTPGAYTYTIVGGYCGIVSEQWTYPSSNCGTQTISVAVLLSDDRVLTGQKAVRMSSGVWVYEYTKGTCFSFCNDYGMPRIINFYSGPYKYEALVYWEAREPDGSCTNGYSVSGTGGFTALDGVQVNSLPYLSLPYPGTGRCGGGCGGYMTWGGCGVCGHCTARPHGRICYYAYCVRVYRWACP